MSSTMSLRPPTLPRHFFRATLQDARPFSEAPQSDKAPEAHPLNQARAVGDLIYDSEEDDWFEEAVSPSASAIRPLTQELEDVVSLSVQSSTITNIHPPTLPRHFFRVTLEDGRPYSSRPRGGRHHRDQGFIQGNHPLSHFVYSTEESVDLQEAEEDFRDQVEEVLQQIDLLDFLEIPPPHLDPEGRHFSEEQYLSEDDDVDEEEIEDTENTEGSEVTGDMEATGNTDSRDDIEDTDDIQDAGDHRIWLHSDFYESSDYSEYTIDSDESDSEEDPGLLPGTICCDIQIYHSDSSEDSENSAEDEGEVLEGSEYNENTEGSEVTEDMEATENTENTDDIEDTGEMEDPGAHTMWLHSDFYEGTIGLDDSDGEDVGPALPDGAICDDIQIYYSDSSEDSDNSAEDEGEDMEDNLINMYSYRVYSGNLEGSEDTENTEGSEVTENIEATENTNSRDDIEDTGDIEDQRNHRMWLHSDFYEGSDYTIGSDDSDTEEDEEDGAICSDSEDLDDSEDADNSEDSDDLDDSGEVAEASDDSGQVAEAHPLQLVFRQDTAITVVATTSLMAAGGLLQARLQDWGRDQLEELVVGLLMVIMVLVVLIIQLGSRLRTRH